MNRPVASPVHSVEPMARPNKGSDVWLVSVDAKWRNGIDASHYLVEVNRQTGAPTLVGAG